MTMSVFIDDELNQDVKLLHSLDRGRIHVLEVRFVLNLSLTNHDLFAESCDFIYRSKEVTDVK